MKRRLAQLCFALGLLLTLAAVVLWARGFWGTDQILAERTTGDTRDLMMLSLNRHSPMLSGLRVTGFKQGRAVPPIPWSVRYDRVMPVDTLFLRDEPDWPWWERLGFALQAPGGPAGPGATRLLTVAAPWWFIVLACGGVTGATFRALRRDRHRRAAGLCPACGYDLRGANHERCPECGEPIKAPAPAAV